MKYQRYNASVSRLSSEGDHKSVEKNVLVLRAQNSWLPEQRLWLKTGKFCLRYEVPSRKSQVSGRTILFTGNQLQRGNKTFNIQKGRYIGKPQTIHTACC